MCYVRPCESAFFEQETIVLVFSLFRFGRRFVTPVMFSGVPKCDEVYKCDSMVL